MAEDKELLIGKWTAVHGAGGGNKELEVLFPPGPSFTVESVVEVGQAVVVVLREL
jgi:hypothetical protein